MVDRLLLRYLPSCVSQTRRGQTVPTYLIADNCLSGSFDEHIHLFGIPPFIHEANSSVLLQQYPRTLPDFSQCAVNTVGDLGSVLLVISEHTWTILNVAASSHAPL